MPRKARKGGVGTEALILICFVNVILWFTALRKDISKTNAAIASLIANSPNGLNVSAETAKKTTSIDTQPQVTGCDRLFDAIRQVESSGNDRAVGDGGKSLGPYQIGKLYWADGCQWGGANWDYDELVWSRPHCERVMRWYWARYKATTDCERAIIHNAGPSGLKYWNRIKGAVK